MTAKNVKFYHHEIVHPDPIAAAKFMQEVFGAEPIEPVLAEGISAACRTICKHVLLGGIVFQFIQPGILPASWRITLDSNGPCIHDVCLCLDNVKETRDSMLTKGCKLIGDMEFTPEALESMHPGSGGIQLDGTWIDAIDQCGLRFELAGNELAPFWPCYTGKKQQSEYNFRYMHHEIVHPDPIAAAKFMQEVFGAEPIEPVLAEGISTTCRTVCKHVLLGGTVFQFIQPGALPASWQTALDSNGPCIHNLCFCLDNVKELRESMLAKGCKLIADMAFTPEALESLFPGAGIKQLDGTWIDAIDQCGLRFELAGNELAPFWPCYTGNFR